jgi:hypothetical protein
MPGARRRRPAEIRNYLFGIVSYLPEDEILNRKPG